MITFIFGVGFMIILVLGFIYAKALGRAQERQSNAEKIHKKALKAKKIHDRLYRDDDYARRVRGTFRR